MGEIKHYQYPSSISEITSVNKSFDSCTLRIAYVGANRNGSFISKNAFEKAFPTMAYCPIVAHYDIHNDTIGGHDYEFVTDDAGNCKMVNLTDAIGVIPADPVCYWEDIEEDDGTVHTYLCTQALIWKRAAVYEKIKTDGITSQSMEITVNSGHMADDYYYIDDFDYTAFAVIGVEPCFESASIEFSKYEESMHNMLEDFKREFSKVVSDNNEDPLKGGTNNLEEKISLLEQFNLTADELDFSIEEMSIEELTAKLSEIASAPKAPEEEVFSLTAEQMIDGIRCALMAIKTVDEYGEFPRYSYVDYAPDTNMVYCYDLTDWNLYGFAFAMNGDNVVIDFDSKKRMKVSIVEFDEGEEPTQNSLEEAINQFSVITIARTSAEFNAEIDKQRAEYEEKLNALNEEVSGLRAYRNAKLQQERADAEEALFAEFADLDEIEEFNQLRDNCAELTLDDIKEKCYAIRGRNPHVFSVKKPVSVKLPVDGGTPIKDNEPYGGLFIEFPPHC